MKIVIIGAGLAGSMAAGALSSYSPMVIDKAKGPRQHHAVMRLRDPAIGMYLGVPLEEIEVHKSIYLFREDAIYDTPSIRENNEYSLKLYGRLGKRSLYDLKLQKRYLLSKGFTPPGVFWNCGVQDFIPGYIKIEEKHATGTLIGKEIPYDVCISTMPLPYTIKICGITHNPEDKFESRPIWVLRNYLKVPSNIHQTFYIPDIYQPIYRATIQNQTVIIESLEEDVTSWALDILTGGFGIDPELLDGDWSINRMEYGKMVPINDDARRHYIMRLTKDFNIYSLGRYAIWKPIRADDLVEDIRRIVHLINVSKIQAEYEGRKL